MTLFTIKFTIKFLIHLKYVNFVIIEFQIYLNTKKEILKYLTENKSAFKKEFGLIKIGLFGSYAKDQNNNLSDIDLIVEFEPDTEMLFEKKKILKAILRKRFSVEVDLCREKYIKKYYRKQILKSAIYV